ncbi:hypothetical protein ECE50_010470 [Chitinophaga sp. Mgbs1]|uniref:Uncharacterized protein n=1 Tax=Chitinophaga solisilvae TaxID=1233460 RepID=A0A433WMR5_9BACT|nr:hypothetical protein [Chitinophaga solisilvae]
MKARYFSWLLLAAVSLSSCSKEDNPGFTPDLGIAKKYMPPADAPAEIKAMYEHYGVWMRMDFNDWKEVTNGVLATDPINRWGVGKIEPAYRSSATIYAQTLLSQVTETFAKRFFPLELFFVKSYSGSFWKKDITTIGRSRLIICWPNEMYGALPVTDPERHYFMDTVLTRRVWQELGGQIAGRMEQPITAFVLGGKAYDNGEAYDKILKQYQQDGDQVARDAANAELARNGGYISANGSRSFESDFPDWLSLIATESYENIKAKYLDNSPARARKYEVIIRHFNSYGWDIQKIGNEYRQKTGN